VPSLDKALIHATLPAAVILITAILQWFDRPAPATVTPPIVNVEPQKESSRYELPAASVVISRAALPPPTETDAPSAIGVAVGTVVVVVEVVVVEVVVVEVVVVEVVVVEVVVVDVDGETVVDVVVVVDGTFVVLVIFFAVVVGASVVVVSATVVVVVSRVELLVPASAYTRSSAGGRSALTLLATKSGCSLSVTSLNPRFPNETTVDS
jgi:hypothetical protein